MADRVSGPAVGRNIARARKRLGLSQVDLAARCGLSQPQISYLETGGRLPSLEHLVEIAAALDAPIQKLLAGDDRPGTDLAGFAVELRALGVVDLWVEDAVVPGAFRRPEEVVAIAVAAESPDPRVVEAIPAVLAWNRIDPALLRAFGIVAETTHRLAWLADVALTIASLGGFPGGCERRPLERFLKGIELPGDDAPWDDLGRPSDRSPSPPVSKRWRIIHHAGVAAFEERAKTLVDLRTVPRKSHDPKAIIDGKRRRPRVS